MFLSHFFYKNFYKMNQNRNGARVKKQSYNLKADFEYLKDNNYHVVKEIDRGSYGVVYKVLIFDRRGLRQKYWWTLCN